MSYDEEEVSEEDADFRMGDSDMEDEEIGGMGGVDFGLDEEDPDKDR